MACFWGGLVNARQVCEEAVPPLIGGLWTCNNGSNFRIQELSKTDFSVVRSATPPRTATGGIGGDSDTIWFTALYNDDKCHELSTIDFSIIRSSTDAYFDDSVGGNNDVIWMNTGNDFKREMSVIDFSTIKALSTGTGDSGFGIGGDSSVIWECGQSVIRELSTTDFSVIRSETLASLGLNSGRGIGGNSTEIWYSNQISEVYQLSTVDFSVISSSNVSCEIEDLGG